MALLTLEKSCPFDYDTMVLKSKIKGLFLCGLTMSLSIQYTHKIQENVFRILGEISIVCLFFLSRKGNYKD